MKKLPLCSLLAGLLLASPASAAEESPAKVPAPPLLSFDFAGGSVNTLVSQLNATPAGSISIIGDPEEMKTEVPAFTLRNVQPESIGNALGQFLDSRGLMLLSSNLPGVPANRQIYTLRRQGRPRSSDAFEAIQLAPFLEHQKVDDIVGAIRAAWELDPGHEAAALRIKYHPATSILLVSGPGEATALASKVVNTLKRSNDHAYAPGQKAEPSPKPAEKR